MNPLFLIHLLLQTYALIIITVCIMDYFLIDQDNAVVKFIKSITEPVLYYVRKYIISEFGGFDLAPFVVLIVIQIIDFKILEILSAH